MVASARPHKWDRWWLFKISPFFRSHWLSYPVLQLKSCSSLAKKKISENDINARDLFQHCSWPFHFECNQMPIYRKLFFNFCCNSDICVFEKSPAVNMDPAPHLDAWNQYVFLASARTKSDISWQVIPRKNQTVLYFWFWTTASADLQSLHVWHVYGSMVSPWF